MSRLTAAARHQVRVHRERLVRKASSIGRSAPSRLESREAAVRGAWPARLGPVSLGHLGRQDERLHSWRRLLSAYDVERQLERGYSLTLTAGGALVRSADRRGRGAGDRDEVRRRHRPQHGGGSRT